ncbi:putative murein hydrolase (TIGR00659 family) [Anaerosolibacter carboniphilus]|uniref:Putative murein hydrolase (TIGR00659 family) n=1 Tax=Anaerosolibacter carboniphilus TaxID=1417629 RepID=A0A841L7F4_9FIRM|nr:LrgB family protein [Anaerosolibacter carboniphilus]MBB6219002.1 putative murein hydrolase (TIGR00659 family) [Anaerosolibacter carboniphilus]
MLDYIENNVVFSVLISLGAFFIGQIINKRLKHPIFNPFLIAISLIMIILKATGLSYEVYKDQSAVLSILLGPATVALAIPLYKNIDILKTNFKAIFIGIIAGVTASISSVMGIGYLLGTQKEIVYSLAPKAVTIPIAIEVSRVIGGIPSLTAGLVTITGVFGACFAPEILRFFNIKSAVAKGIAIGTTTHALGTSRAFQEGEIEGAMSSLAIGIAGVATAFVVPFMAHMFQ